MLQMEDFLGGTTMIPLQVALPPDQQKPRQKDVGLLSTLSSYLLSPYGSNSDTPRVPTCTDSEVEATLSAVDCLNSCRFEELYGQIMCAPTLAPQLASTGPRILTDARFSCIPLQQPEAWSSSVCRSGAEGPCRPTNHRSSSAAEGQWPWARYADDPRWRCAGCCAVPERLRPSLRLSDGDAGQHLEPSKGARRRDLVRPRAHSPSGNSCSEADTLCDRPLVFDHLSHVLSTAESHSILLIERAVVGLLRLCSAISSEVSCSLRA
jgi:brefeldin A-resistance guanine nucleotide exchange factor 1